MDDFNQKSYQQSNLRKDTVEVGDDVYKLITSEVWSLYIPLSIPRWWSLAGRENMRVPLCKGRTDSDGQVYTAHKRRRLLCENHLYQWMIRYASDRFVEIELVTNTETGLKIPLSSIVNKDFYVIPTGYETTGNEQ